MIESVMVKGMPDSNKKSCFDCRHCQAAVNWWCNNKAAVAHRGTRLPGVINCKFWEPVKTINELSWLERHFGDFIKIEA